jgi:hypothetical protein
MPGDNINTLPLNNDVQPKKSDLEIIYNLFNSPEATEVVKQTVSSLKLSILAGILFVILSLPLFTELVNKITKEKTIYTKGILTLIFITLFYIIQKTLLK